MISDFKPRDYQQAFFDAFLGGKYNWFVLVWPRRSGKDLSVLNMCVKIALDTKKTIYFILPSLRHAQVISQYLFSRIPKEYIKEVNKKDLVVTLTNDSCIKIRSSDRVDAIKDDGELYVLSEYGLHHDSSLGHIAALIIDKGIKAIFMGTPVGPNHFWYLYQIALNSNKFFCQVLTVEDTKHISIADIKYELESGLISEKFCRQEYYSEFK